MQRMLLVSTLALAAGCGGSSRGTGSLAIKATGTGVPTANAAQGILPMSLTSSEGTTFTLTAARVNLREIRLVRGDSGGCTEVKSDLDSTETCDDSSGETEIDIAGPFIVDLLTGVATPSLSSVKVPSGNYRRVEFRVDDTQASQNLAATDPLANHSLAATADFIDQGVTKHLELALDFNEDHRVEPAGGVNVSADGGQLLLLLDATHWFDNIPISTCLANGDLQVSGDDVILDSQAQGGCSDAENLIKDNIKGSEELEAH